MPTLTIILGAAGVVLILVAAVGGGISLSSIEIPRVGFGPRVISFVMGSVLVVFALGVDSMQWPNSPGPVPVPVPGPGPRPGPGPTSAGGYVMATPGYNVMLFKAPSLSASTVSDAPDGVPDGQNVDILCTMEGDTVTFGGNTSALWDGVSINNVVGFIPDVHVNTGTTQPAMPNCETLWNQSGRNV